jgi:hypothetical protein
MERSDGRACGEGEVSASPSKWVCAWIEDGHVILTELPMLPAERTSDREPAWQCSLNSIAARLRPAAPTRSWWKRIIALFSKPTKD